MVTQLGPFKLRDGSHVTIAEVDGPDAAYRDRVLERLAHKPRVWLWQVELALDGKCPGLGARFYVPEMDGQVVGNISCWQTGPIGMISHVFTDEAYRGRGIASVVMATTVSRLTERGGRVLSLLTEPGSRPFRIYERAGFRVVCQDGGHMVWEHEPGDLDRLFGGGRAWHARPAQWSDWPGAGVLYCVGSGGGAAVLRSMRHGVFGPACFEAEFLTDRHLQHTGALHQFVLEADHVIGGYASLGPDPRWREAVWLLDLFVHPACVRFVPDLLGRIDWPNVKVQCYVDADQTAIAAALEHVGFQEEARLGHQITSPDGRPLDCVVLARRA